MTERKFAYGGPCVDGVNCPMSEAGFDGMWEENPWYNRVADQYDLYVALELFERDGGDIEELNEAAIHHSVREKGYEEGVIDEELARECWLQATEAQDMNGGPCDEGIEVAETLGWV